LYHHQAADPAPGAGRLCAGAVGAQPGAADSQHAVITTLITEVFKHADQAVAAPNHEPTPARPAPRFCNSLFIAVAVKPSCAGNFMFVVEKKEAAKLHNHSPALEPPTIQIRQADFERKSVL
jgi:hypothetical protein